MEIFWIVTGPLESHSTAPYKKSTLSKMDRRTECRERCAACRELPQGKHAIGLQNIDNNT
jgi:hypothetical protein